MNGDREDGESDAGSAPCYLHELDAAGHPVDPVQARDLGRWRKSERERLIALRMALPAEFRAAQAAAIGAALDTLLPPGSPVVSVYWPIRAEPDMRPWMHALHARGVRVALPNVVAPGRPLEFREWHPHARLAHGVWRIPYPADGALVTPEVAIAPLVGFDAAGYRLGYGGGFFDRTLASLAPRALAIGIGYAATALATIYPQSYDVPMDWIVTGDGPPRRRGG
ncbi:MAG: 5-formyltetrahydrofolate cyclo-ligase [Proteobacteria bacterium]|nr:5-formyltetrahydrofolate cyclo-ligase [Pseudomonadota bacterium]